MASSMNISSLKKFYTLKVRKYRFISEWRKFMRKLTAILTTLAMFTMCACSIEVTNPKDDESSANVTATEESSSTNRSTNATTQTPQDGKFNSYEELYVAKMSDKNVTTGVKAAEDGKEDDVKSKEMGITSTEKAKSTANTTSTAIQYNAGVSPHTETLATTIVTYDLTISTETTAIAVAAVSSGDQQTYYTVSGDCWSSVAEKFGIWPPEILMQANPQVYSETNDVNSLGVGIQLYIPAANTGYEQVETNTPYVWEENSYSEEYVQQEYFLGDATIYSAPDAASWHNLTLVLDRLNGMTLYPGQIFNFNDRFGDTTVEDGFELAPEYGEGSNTILGSGGGVCVSSTALFQAARNAGLNIIDHKPHSGPCAYAPNPDDQAAISNPGKNLIFSNNCDSTVKFYTDYVYGWVYVSCYKLV